MTPQPNLFEQGIALADQQAPPTTAPSRDFFDVGDALLAVPRGIVDAAKGAYGLADALTGDNLPDWTSNPLGESTSTVGGILEGATNFAAGFIPVGGALARFGFLSKAAEAGLKTVDALGVAKATLASNALAVGRVAAASGLTAFAFMDGHQERLSNLIQAHPDLANPINGFLAADPRDGEIEGRLKNALENAGIGALTEAVVLGLKGLRAANDVKAQGGTPEQARAAQDAAAPPEQVAEAVKRVYHGTAVEFDQFDNAKIGSGEGNQSFGYGHYFADKEAVAERYARSASSVTHADLHHTVDDLPTLREYFKPGNIVPSYGGQDRVLAFNEDQTHGWWVTVEAVDSNGKTTGPPRSHFTAPYQGEVNKVLGVEKAPRVLQVELAPKPDEYLLWDKGLEEQSPKVRAAIETLAQKDAEAYGEGGGLSYYTGDPASHSGRDLYTYLREEHGNQEASAILQRAGIRGVKYLDAASRSAGEGTYNYVVFDAADAKIVPPAGSGAGKPPAPPGAPPAAPGAPGEPSPGARAVRDGQPGNVPGAQNVGTPAQPPTPVEPSAARGALLRGLGITDQKALDILAQNKADVAAIPTRDFPGGLTAPASNAVNPRTLTAPERLAFNLKPDMLNLEHFEAVPQGAREFLRTTERLFETTINEDIAAVAPQTLQEMTDAAVRDVANIAQAGDEHAFMVSMIARMGEGQQVAQRLLTQAIGDRFALATYAEMTASTYDLLDAIKSGRVAGNLSEVMLKARMQEQFFADLVANARGQAASAGRLLRSYAIDVRSLVGAPLSPEALEAAVNAEGGEAFLLKRARQLRIAFGEGGVDGAASLSKAILPSRGKRAFDMLVEYFMNAVLGGPKTAVVNFLGPSTNSIYTPLETALGAKINQGASLLRGDRVAAAAASDVFKQQIAQVHQLMTALPEAIQLAQRVGASGNLDAPVFGQFAKRAAITAANAGLDPGSVAGKGVDWFGNVVRLPTDVLGTTDTVVKQLNVRAQARASFILEALQQPGMTKEGIPAYVADKMDRLIWKDQLFSQQQLFARGQEEARALGETLQPHIDQYATAYVQRAMNDPANAGLLELAQKAAEHAQDVSFTTPAKPGSWSWSLQRLSAQHPVLRLVVPFINTPINILKFTGQRLDVAGAMRVLASSQFPDYAESLANTKNRLIADAISGDPARAAAAVGRTTAGVSLASYVLSKAADGTVTGRGPSSPAERSTLMQSGWQPYSIKTADGYVSYARLDPFATLVGTMADILDYSKYAPVEDQPKLTTLMSGVAVALANNFTNKSYLTGLSNVIDGLEQPDRKLAGILRRFAGSFVPNVAGQGVLALGGDQHMREVHSMLDELYSKTPGLSATLPPQRNVFGEPVLRTQAAGTEAIGRWVDWFNPIAYSKVSDDAVANELASLGHAFTPPKSTLHGMDLNDYKLPSGQTAYDRFGELHGEVKIGGRTMKQALGQKIKSGAYQRLPEDAPGYLESPRIDAVNSIIQTYREAAWRQLMREAPELNAFDRAQVRAQRLMKAGRSVPSIGFAP